jgi:hypothetical protein
MYQVWEDLNVSISFAVKIRGLEFAVDDFRRSDSEAIDRQTPVRGQSLTIFVAHSGQYSEAAWPGKSFNSKTHSSDGRCLSCFWANFKGRFLFFFYAFRRGLQKMP